MRRLAALDSSSAKQRASRARHASAARRNEPSSTSAGGMFCSKSSSTSSSRRPWPSMMFEEPGQLMLELDLWLVQNLDHFRDAAELVAEPLAQSGFVHRTDQHNPFKAGVLRFVAAAEARGYGALAISADTVNEYAVVVAGVGKRLEAALHLAPPAEEGGSAGHLDVAFRIQKVRLGRLPLDLLALRGPERSDQGLRIAHPLIQAQQVPVRTECLIGILQESAQHLAAHGRHGLECCLPGGQGPVELRGGEDARAVVDRLRPPENRVRASVYQGVGHGRDGTAVRRLRRVAAGKKQKPGPAQAEGFGELLRRGAIG